MGALDLENIMHAYGDRQVVDHLSLHVGEGEIVCLLGPSGCGKTTTLRIAAGLEPLQGGTVRIDGQVVAEAGREVPTEKRRVGMVFQDYALFPHQTALQNVAFGLHNLDKSARREKARKMLEKLGIGHLIESYPHTLSGGEQQRVALARALVAEPQVMLMDEPFANLDQRLRGQVREDTIDLLHGEAVATLLVTHDPEEAMLIADRIALMDQGHIVQVGTPDELYNNPVNRFVAATFSELNGFRGTVNDSGRVTCALGEFPQKAERQDFTGNVDVLVRQNGFTLVAAGEGVEARVESCRIVGPEILARLILSESEERVTARFPLNSEISLHQPVHLTAKSQQTFVFPQKEDYIAN